MLLNCALWPVDRRFFKKPPSINTTIQKISILFLLYRQTHRNLCAYNFCASSYWQFLSWASPLSCTRLIFFDEKESPNKKVWVVTAFIWILFWCPLINSRRKTVQCTKLEVKSKWMTYVLVLSHARSDSLLNIYLFVHANSLIYEASPHVHWRHYTPLA